jgi:hypothetical protein
VQQFDATANETRFEGLDGGAWASRRQNGWTVLALLHANRLQGEIGKLATRGGAPVSETGVTGSNALGLVLGAHWQRTLAGGWYLKPGFTLSTTRRTFDNTALFSTEAAFSDTSAQRGDLSLDVGRMVETATFSNQFWASLGAHAASGDDNATFIASGPGVAGLDPVEDQWGSIGLGWTGSGRQSPLAFTAQVEHVFGGSVRGEGTVLSLGARLRY